ncbi:putative transmembrane protein [Gregarina niphandrodes]|uniref:Transmembrane protein n=1 Tax=Gregarina niphandrodes TaxID=110365 RepID=A0A023B6P1_GRENI|nr:putative transmembrane protein [Gregarina niphandrodes]EZG66659.1 putative transmembrane protein [Gregarina niphandrodes]|eukprot:XP_011130553.1 putative transmembrane protein [Gregarina niphandrodes]
MASMDYEHTPDSLMGIQQLGSEAIGIIAGSSVSANVTDVIAAKTSGDEEQPISVSDQRQRLREVELRLQSEASKAAKVASSGSLWKKAEREVKNLFSSGETTTDAEAEKRYLRNIVADQHVYKSDGALPDPLTEASLCNAPFLDLGIEYCDPDHLNGNTDAVAHLAQLSAVFQNLERINTHSLTTPCNPNTSVKLGIAVAGPTLPVSFPDCLAATWETWKLGHFDHNGQKLSSECDESLLLGVRLLDDGSVDIEGKMGDSVRKIISPTLLRKIGQVVSSNVAGKSVKTKPLLALTEMVDFVQMAIAKEVQSPRQAAQAWVIGGIFVVMVSLFTAAVL